MNPFSSWLRSAAQWLGVFLVLVIPTTVVSGSVTQGGTFNLFSDSELTDTTYQDHSIAPFSVYVVHRGITSGAIRGVRFMVEASPGVTFSWVSESSIMPIVLGDSRTGISIDYNACLAPDPGLILQIQYVGFGTSQPCSMLKVVPHPDAINEEIEAVSCQGIGPFSVLAQSLVVNCALPVQGTTWGKVKSLYR